MELTNTSPDKRRLFGRWFARRITTYLVVCAFLAFVNWQTSPHYWWVAWVAAGWGLNLVLSLSGISPTATTKTITAKTSATMKAWKLVLTVIFALASVAAAAKTLEITVTDIRSDKGNVLAMAKVAGHEQPVYGMSPAKRGEVVVTLEGIDAETAEVSLLHDEDGDYKMKTGERGPAEGYAAKKCALPAERNAVTIRLRYPAAE